MLPDKGYKEHETLGTIQEKVAILPDYALPAEQGNNTSASTDASRERVGTSLSGIVGGMITLVVCVLVGVILRKRTQAPTI